MTLVIYCVLSTDRDTGRFRTMGCFDTLEEAHRQCDELRRCSIFHSHRVTEVLWSLAPLGRAS